MRVGAFIFAQALILLFVPAHAETYAVQIGAYKEPAAANTRRAADIGKIAMRKGKDGLTRISVGQFKTEEDAQAALQQVRNAGYMDAFISDERGREVGRRRVVHKIMGASRQKVRRANRKAEDRRLIAAKAKVPADQHRNIVYLDGRLVLKEGDTFRDLE